MKISRGVIVAHVISILPLILLAVDLFSQNLTANPIQAITLRTGRTAINLLLVSLACSPLRNIFGIKSLLKMRIVFGLYAFFYSLAHFLVFSGLDYEFNAAWIVEEMRTKPFLQVGLSGLLILSILAVSSVGMVLSWMKQYWQRLQRLVYPAAGLIIWHTFLAAKGDIRASAIRGILYFTLMLARIKPIKNKLVIRVKWIEVINQFFQIY